MAEAAQTDQVGTDAPIEITEAAAERLADEMTTAEGTIRGLRLLVDSGECGLRYGLSFARDGAQESEVTISSHDVNLFIEEDALPFVEGATVDYREGLFGEGFAIENPNETEGGCGSGCGCR